MQTYRGRLRTSAVLLALLLLAAVSGGCKKDSGSSNPTSSTPAANQVVMQNTAFSPSSLTVTAGTTVKWTNNDAMTHTVSAGTPSAPSTMFDSGNMGMGATYQFTFNTKGTFQYYCKIHPTIMQATITVQ